MELKGKKINFLGDSITQGCGTTDEEACRFSTLLLQSEGLAASRNYGIGGTRIARQRITFEKEIYDLDFCMRALEMDADADAVVVFGGTNDYGHGDAPFGTPADRTEYTFWGALHTLYTTLRSRYPEAKLLVVTPLHRAVEDNPLGDPPVKPAPGECLPAYVDAIRRRAAEFGIPVLDLYEQSFLDARKPEILRDFVPDGLHPNDRGHEILAREIAEALKRL